MIWSGLTYKNVSRRGRLVRGRALTQVSRTVKLGAPKWSFIDYQPNPIVPAARTGHTVVTHGDSIFVYVSWPLAPGVEKLI